MVREAGERKLAVKMIRKGRDDLPGSDVERLIMWEVHSLRELAPRPHRATFNTRFGCAIRCTCCESSASTRTSSR